MSEMDEARDACAKLQEFGNNVIGGAQGSKQILGQAAEDLRRLKGQTNTNSLPRAIRALQDAATSMGRVATAVESMQRATKGFIADKLENA